MNQVSLLNILVNDATATTNNSRVSSTGAIRSSSSKTTALSSTFLKSRAKTINNPSISIRQSEWVANSNQNHPNINTTKQPPNLPVLPEEDITVILDFTNNTTPTLNSCKHACSLQNTAIQFPAKKKGQKGKGKDPKVPLDVDLAEAFLDTALQCNAPPSIQLTSDISSSPSQALPLDTPAFPPSNANRSPPPAVPESIASPFTPDGL